MWTRDKSFTTKDPRRKRASSSVYVYTKHYSTQGLQVDIRAGASMTQPVASERARRRRRTHASADDWGFRLLTPQLLLLLLTICWWMCTIRDIYCSLALSTTCLLGCRYLHHYPARRKFYFIFLNFVILYRLKTSPSVQYNPVMCVKWGERKRKSKGREKTCFLRVYMPRKVTKEKRKEINKYPQFWAMMWQKTRRQRRNDWHELLNESAVRKLKRKRREGKTGDDRKYFSLCL